MGLFGGEKITLKMERYDYYPGDTIKGTVTLNLSKPVKARRLEIAFIGEKIQKGQTMGTSHGSHGHSPGHTTHGQTHTKIYNFILPLDGEKEYMSGSYPFEIKIPLDILEGEAKLEGKLGAAVSVLKTLSGTSSRIEWYVKAKLDIPMGLDVAKVQQIVLSGRSTPPGGF